MNSTNLIHEQQEMFIALIINFFELSMIGFIGGCIAYILEYYLLYVKHQQGSFETLICFLHGVLGAFSAFIVITMFPLDNLKLTIGLAALSGLISVPLLMTLKSAGLNYIFQKIFGNSFKTDETTDVSK